MRRILHYLLSLLLAATFLVSFTGVRLLVHHCLGCDTKEIVFASEAVPCCASERADSGVSHKAKDDLLCCAVSESSQCGVSDEQGCCDVTLVYLKGEFQFTQHKVTDNKDIQLSDVLADTSTDTFDFVRAQVPAFELLDNDPPPRIVGKAFVLFAHHIKIA